MYILEKEKYWYALWVYLKEKMEENRPTKNDFKSVGMLIKNCGPELGWIVRLCF